MQVACIYGFMFVGLKILSKLEQLSRMVGTTLLRNSFKSYDYYRLLVGLIKNSLSITIKFEIIYYIAHRLSTWL